MNLIQNKYLEKYIKKVIYPHKNLYYICRFIKDLKYTIFSLHFHKYPLTDIVVCGIPRSGSTLLFNILREMIRIDLDKLDGYFETDKEYEQLLKSEKSYYIKKTHNLSWILLNRIKRKESTGFFTHRDIRDIVVSMMQKGWIKDFNKFIRFQLTVIINIALIYASVKNMHIYSYDELINNKMKVIKDLQTILNINLDKDSIFEIIKRTSIEETKKAIERLPKNQEYDPTSHLHKAHIKNGKIGKWNEELTDSQIKMINSVAKNYLRYFNYIDD